jgi:glutathione S-transferase
MKLYFAPGSCSMSPHIVLRETGLAFDLVQVDLAAQKTRTGQDFARINPKGYVPALELDDGSVLTEGSVIVQYLADRKPESGLIPKAGTMERVRLQEWLNYISTELHKSFGPFFDDAAPEAYRAAVRGYLEKKLDWVQGQLEGRTFLTGKSFSVADAYLFTVLGWLPAAQLDLARWPVLAAYRGRIGERPKVKESLAVEEKAKAK